MASGHLNMIERVACQFGQVAVLVARNPNKQSMFNVEERMDLTRQCTQRLGNIRVGSWSRLLVSYASTQGTTHLVKGLRSAADYEYEAPMAQMNQRMTGIEILLMGADPKYGHVSLTLMKEIV